MKELEAIVPDITKTAQLVQEITAASIEQNSGSDQVNNAIQQLNDVTQQNAAAAEEMATSSEELASQSDQLRETIAFFKLENIKKTDSNILRKRNKQNPSPQKPKTQHAKKEGYDFKLNQDDQDLLDKDFEKI